MVKKPIKKKYFFLALIPPIIIATLFIIIPLNMNSNQLIYFLNLNPPSGIPYQIRATWGHENASDSITITWKSNSLQESIIKYDLTSKNGDERNYSSECTGQTTNFSNIEGFIHTVALINLIPNTTYYFICGSNSGGWSNEFKFKTPALQPKNITFVAGGDARTNIGIRNGISNLMAQYNPEFVLFSGDAIDDGTNQGLWEDWFNSIQKYWVRNDSSIIQIIPCLGNHENNASNYYEQYTLPNNEQWFAIDYSNFLHIICLNSETNISGDQLIWLENDLKQYNDTIWKIVFFHQPPYSSGEHPAREDIQALWCPIFDTYNVSVVFNGHNHIYERSKPIRNNSTAVSYLNGTMYVTSGGWGAPLYSINPKWWTEYTESAYHFCLINISVNSNNSTFTLKEIRSDNTIGDSISFEKNLI